MYPLCFYNMLIQFENVEDLLKNVENVETENVENVENVETMLKPIFNIF